MLNRRIYTDTQLDELSKPDAEGRVLLTTDQIGAILRAIRRMTPEEKTEF